MHKASAAKGILFDQATRFIENGFSIFPIRPGTKQPITRWKAAQTSHADKDRLQNWLGQYPKMSIGIVTGVISQLVVIDVDGDDADPEFMDLLTPTTVVRSRRGWHHYYRTPPGKIIPTKVGFLHHIDIKGEGAYVVAPPSIGELGHIYHFISPLSKMADLPDAVLQRIEATKAALETETTYGETKWRQGVLGVGEGKRNTSAAAIIGKLLEKTPEELWEFNWAAVQEWNLLNTPPMDVKELRRTFDSIKGKEVLKRAAERAQGSDEEEIDLQSADRSEHRLYGQPSYAIGDLLIDGLSMIVGKPKRGKTVLTMQMSLSVATGRKLFDNSISLGEKKFTITQGDVLYLALEDNEGRFIRRARDIAGTHRLPANLYYATKWPSLGQGALNALHRWVDEHIDARLIVIDSLTAFLGTNLSLEPKSGNAFKVDYNIMRSLFDFSQERKLSVLVIHHARKSLGKWNEQDDPMDAISGTLGSAAAVDTYLYMDRQLDSEHALLHIAGRDVPSHRVALHQPRPTNGHSDVMSRFALGDMETFLTERRGKSKS